MVATATQVSNNKQTNVDGSKLYPIKGDTQQKNKKPKFRVRVSAVLNTVCHVSASSFYVCHPSILAGHLTADEALAPVPGFYAYGFLWPL